MGSISANFGASSAYTVVLEWTEAARDVAANRTEVDFACRLLSNRATAAFTGQARSDAFSVGGQTFTCAHDAFTLTGNGTVALWSRRVALDHDADGSCTRSVSFSISIDTTFSSSGYVGAAEASGTLTLTSIPRASDLDVPAFTAGSPGRVTIRAAASDFTHDLYISFGSVRQCIAYDVTERADWTPSLDLLAQVPGAVSGTGTMTLYTYRSRVLVGERTKDFTLYVPQSVTPSVASFTVTVVNDNAVAAAWGVAIRSLSKLHWAASATPGAGSTLASYAVSAGGVTGTGASGTTAALPSAGSVTPRLTVTDARGRTASASAAAVTVLDYGLPALTRAAARRCAEDGTLSSQGTFCRLDAAADCASVGGRNHVSLRYRVKAPGGSFSAWSAASDGQILPDFPLDATRIVELSAVDALGGTRTVTLTVAAAPAALHLRPGGKGAAFGKYAEADGILDVAWDLRVRGDYLDADGNEIDRVVEAGSSGIWRWRKWRSGFAECWGEQNCIGNASTAWGGLYALECAAPDYPIAFTDWPNVQRDVVCYTEAGCWLSAYGTGTPANCGPFALLRPTAMQVSASVKFYVTGHWK